MARGAQGRGAIVLCDLAHISRAALERAHRIPVSSSCPRRYSKVLFVSRGVVTDRRRRKRAPPTATSIVLSGLSPSVENALIFGAECAQPSIDSIDRRRSGDRASSIPGTPSLLSSNGSMSFRGPQRLHGKDNDSLPTHPPVSRPRPGHPADRRRRGAHRVHCSLHHRTATGGGGTLRGMGRCPGGARAEGLSEHYRYDFRPTTRRGFFMSSGLLLASRWPLVHADFTPYYEEDDEAHRADMGFVTAEIARPTRVHSRAGCC